jgi:DHA2 family multidrug resistance protein
MSDVAEAVDSAAGEPDRYADVTERYRWVTLGVVTVGTLMVVLDTSIVNVALPDIGESFHAGEGIEWVVTAYLLAVAVSQPATGWLADRFGRKRAFTWSLGCFTAASMACALAPSLPILVLFRVLQGFGGGAMMPVGMAMIFEVFPHERRGHAMGVWGIAAMAGPAIGPTTGGYLVTAVSWHWLFLINVPVGLVGVLLAHHNLRDFGHREHRSLDVVGLLLGAAGLALALLGITQSGSWGWTSPATLGLIVVGVTLLVAFARHGVRSDNPIVDMKIFGVGIFAISILIVLFTAAAQYTRLVYLPLELENLRGYTPLRVGLILIPSALGTAATMPIGGRLVDRVGARLPIVIGCTMMFAAALGLGNLAVSTPIPIIMVLLTLQGMGMGLTSAPATVVGLNALSGRFVAQASAMRSLTSQVAGATAISIAAAVVAARMGDHPSPAHAQTAYNTAFLVAAGGVAIAALLALRLPKGLQAPPDGEGSTTSHVVMGE